MSNLPENFRALCNSDRHQDWFKNNPDLMAILYTTSRVIEELNSGRHPGDILGDVADNLAGKDPKKMFENFTSALKVLQLFPQSVRSNDKDRYWISPDSLRLMLGNTVARRMYLGLVYQLTDTSIQFHLADKSVNFKKDIFRPAAESELLAAAFQGYVSGIVDRGSVVAAYLRDVTRKEPDKVSYADYYKTYNASLDLFEYALQAYTILMADSVRGAGAKLEPRVSTLLFSARRLGDMYLDVNRKQYVSAIIKCDGIDGFSVCGGIFGQGISHDACEIWVLHGCCGAGTVRR